VILSGGVAAGRARGQFSTAKRRQKQFKGLYGPRTASV